MFPHAKSQNGKNTNKQTDSEKPFQVPTESRKKNAGTAAKGRRCR